MQRQLLKLKRAENSTIDLTKYTYHKEGYTFEGWYADKELTEKITSIKLKEDVVFYANWEIKKEESGGNRPASLTTEHYAYIMGREDNMVYPDANITRAEAMTLVNRMLQRIPESEDDLLGNMTRWEDNSDKTAWYYLIVQEATNSHDYEMKADSVHEKWTKLTESPNWIEIEN